ncbi:MAG: hypothetical protein K8J31_14365, partial [Anaerolineae bacterium]|nr:hypothetical protein [Anaerolineae bacterium]
FYTSITAIGAFAMLGLFTLIVYPRAIGRWVLPGVLAVAFAAPEVVNKAQYVTGRLAATQTLSLPPFIEALANIFRDYTGPAFVVWAGLFILGLGLMVVRRSGRRAHVLALLLWAAGMPVLLYLSNPVLGFFSPRYAWWVLPGLALLAAWGLAELPRAGQILAGGILALMLFLPLPRDGHYQIWDVLSPLGDDFAWLREHMQWGDVILSHDRNTCGATEEWDYYLRAYFPTGVRFVDTPAGFRRIWVLNPKDLPDDLQARLNDQHIPGRFVGPPGCLFRLYEAPPDVEGIAFANGMRFHGAEVLREGSPVSGPLVMHEGEAIQVRLWWSVDRPPELDYSVNTLLRRGSTVYDTVDGPPLAAYPVDAPTETSRWLPGTVYVETRTLTLPFPGANTYTVGMIVYFWADGVPISAPGVDSDGVLPLLQVRVKSY